MPRREMSQQSTRKPLGTEPALAALLDDPITHMLMAADRVAKDDLDCLLQKARAQRRQISALPTPSSLAVATR